MEILEPGPPGAGPYPDVVFRQLVARGCARWLPDPEGGTFFWTTPRGQLAIACTRAANALVLA